MIIVNGFQQFPVDLFKFTEEMLNGELHFLCIKISDVVYKNQHDGKSHYKSAFP